MFNGYTYESGAGESVAIGIESGHLNGPFLINRYRSTDQARLSSKCDNLAGLRQSSSAAHVDVPAPDVFEMLLRRANELT